MIIIYNLYDYNLSNANSLERVSINNQECKVRPEIVNINSNKPILILLVLEQVNAVVVVKISMIPKQNCVFLMLLRTLILKISI